MHEGQINDSQSETQDTPTVQHNEKAIDLLHKGFSSICLPGLESSQKHLSELTKNQQILLETVQNEQKRLEESEVLDNVRALMANTHHYHEKLQRIKKDMLTLHEKSRRLKTRALRLQQERQSLALREELERERRSEMDKRLTAKPASK